MAKKKDRKRAENRYEHLASAQVELDFHGTGSIKPQEIKQRTEKFVESSKAKGLKKIRIITGKGLNSKGAPVVKPQVERTLRAMMRQGIVKSFYPEKPQHGGDGAFAVEL